MPRSDALFDSMVGQVQVVLYRDREIIDEKVLPHLAGDNDCIVLALASKKAAWDYFAPRWAWDKKALIREDGRFATLRDLLAMLSSKEGGEGMGPQTTALLRALNHHMALFCREEPENPVSRDEAIKHVSEALGKMGASRAKPGPLEHKSRTVPKTDTGKKLAAMTSQNPAPITEDDVPW